MNRRTPPDAGPPREPPRRWVWFLSGFCGAGLLAALLIFDPAEFGDRDGEPPGAVLRDPAAMGEGPGVEGSALRPSASRVPEPEEVEEALDGPRGRPADMVVSLRWDKGGVVVEVDDEGLPGSDPATLWELLTVQIRAAVRAAPPEEAADFRVAVRAADEVPWSHLLSAMSAASRAGAVEAELIGGGEKFWDDPDEFDLEMEGVLIDLRSWGRRPAESR